MSLAAVAEKAVRGSAPDEDGRADIIGFVLTIMSDACAAGASNEELAIAMFGGKKGRRGKNEPRRHYLCFRSEMASRGAIVFRRLSIA